MQFNVRPLVVLDGLTTTYARYLIFPGTTPSTNFGRVYKLIKGAPHRSMKYPIQREPRDTYNSQSQNCSYLILSDFWQRQTESLKDWQRSKVGKSTPLSKDMRKKNQKQFFQLSSDFSHFTLKPSLSVCYTISSC